MFLRRFSHTCDSCEYLAYIGDETYACVKNLSEKDRINNPEYGEIVEPDVDRACEDYKRYFPCYDDYDRYIDHIIIKR